MELCHVFLQGCLHSKVLIAHLTMREIHFQMSRILVHVKQAFEGESLGAKITFVRLDLEVDYIPVALQVLLFGKGFVTKVTLIRF